MSHLEEVILKNEKNTDRIMEKATHYIVINNNNFTAMRSSYENTTTQAMIKHVAANFIALARSAVRDLNPGDELASIRIMTKKFEYLITPEVEFSIVVQQHHLFKDY